jgi:hypothetical protein
MHNPITRGVTALLLFGLLAGSTQGSEAWSHVDVGRHHADARAGYDAPRGLVRTESRVGDVNVGRAVAVGLGPGGVSLSHSIGLSRGGMGTAHNFQLGIGPGGTHAGHGGVVARGGEARVISGGETSSGYAPGGSNYSSGFGRRVEAWSNSNSRRSPYRHFSSR